MKNPKSNLQTAGCSIAGATSLQIMAVLGHKSLAEAERYTRAYQREEAATEGMRKLETKYLAALRDPQKAEK